MNTLLLDNAAWDLVLDSAGNMALASNPYAIAQDVASAVRTFLDECWYDTTQGLPFWQKILGQFPPLSFMKTQIKDVALAVPEVADAKGVFVSFQNRLLKGQIQVTDIYGNVQLVTF